MRFYLLFFCILVHIQGAPLYKFKGNKDYSKEKLDALIATDWQEYLQHQYDSSYIDDAAYRILQSYRQDGYHFAVVDYQRENDVVTFDIKEYNVVIIQKIKIINAAKEELFFTKKRLKKFITPPPSFGKYVFRKTQIKSDAAAIQTFYATKGFLRTKVNIKYIFEPDPPNAQKVKVEVVVDEGPRAYLQQVILEGNNNYSSDSLRSLLTFKQKQVFEPGMNQKMLVTLREFYRQNSYAQVKIRSLIFPKIDANDPKKENITIKLLINEKKRNYIRDIRIVGNKINHRKLIEQQLEVKKGQLFHLIDIITTEQNLQRTQLFLFAEIKEIPVADDQLDLQIEVQERERQTYSFLLGYNTTYGLVGGVRYENMSIFGSGWRFVTDLESTIAGGNLSKSQLEVSFTNPYVFGERDLAFTVKGFVLLEEETSFTIFDRGLEAFFTKYLIQNISESGLVRNILTAEVGHRINFSEILDAEDDDENEEELTIFSTLHQKLTLDLRNSISYPTVGTFSFIELEQSLTALGSDVDYFKVYVHSAWYFNIILDWVLAVGIRGGVVIPFNDTDAIPIQKRFFGGGASTVRSFDEQQMPPLDAEDNPVGGEGIFLASVELRIPIYAGLGISVFADSGEVIEKVRTFNDYRISQVKYGIGMGIWYNIPQLGALRVDYAYNPDREENPLTGNKEDASKVFVSIGFAF